MKSIINVLTTIFRLKNKVIAIIIFMLLVKSLSGQTPPNLIRVKLNKQLGNGPFQGGMQSTALDTLTKFKNIPLDIKDYIVKTFKLNNEQKAHSWETKISILVGKRNDSTVLILDSNNDKDLKDDIVLTYSGQPKENFSLPYTAIPLNIAGRQQILHVQMIPYKKSLRYHSEIEQKHYLLIGTYEYLTGDVDLINNKTPIYVINLKASSLYNKKYLRIAIRENDELSYYNIGDIITIKQESFVIEGINTTNDTLSLRKPLKNEMQFGNSAGQKIRYSKALNIEGEELAFPVKGKLTLLDFWGTWCAPCKELTPDLKLFQKKYTNKVQLISVAYDQNQKTVKQYIDVNKLAWSHVFQGYDEGKHPLIEQFNISSYPTFILIDSSGKILHRGDGKEALTEIDDLLQNSN